MYIFYSNVKRGRELHLGMYNKEDLFYALNQDYNKSFDFYWLSDFSVILKI